MNSSLSTKEKIVELGRDFVQTLGYHSFKYQQIASALNIKNAAIHHYFPGKEDLGLAIIKKDQQDFLNMVENAEAKSATAKTELLLSVYRSFLKAGKNLCVIGACGSAYVETPEAMQTAARLYLEDMLGWLTQVFQDGLASGEFHFQAEPSAMAGMWVSTLSGTLQVSRIKGSRFFDQSLNQLRKTIHP